MKQETLEEAAEREYKFEEDSTMPNDREHQEFIRIFKKGAKWQSKTMYSEEEVRELFNQYKQEFSIYRNLQILNVRFEEWFEKFKKK
jgi:hypothetical protein